MIEKAYTGALSFLRRNYTRDLSHVDAAVTSIPLHFATTYRQGGDHYSTYPSLKAHVAYHDGQTKNYIIRKHGFMFYYAVREDFIDPQTRIEIVIRTFNDGFMGAKISDAAWIHQNSTEHMVEEIRNRVGNNLTYLTFDIDCLDPVFSSVTGTLVCRGLTMAQIIAILRRLRSINYVGMDIVEVSPPYAYD
ncbi:unnamed protein product [Rotaria socialis]|uniref:Uncharacterized protein n=1 Tax=Rotaria socialis TaxID=392032 RepID=A0A820VID2_9BILA|nr:unnamed protein product [Rotaria socialis]